MTTNESTWECPSGKSGWGFIFGFLGGFFLKFMISVSVEGWGGRAGGGLLCTMGSSNLYS